MLRLSKKVEYSLLALQYMAMQDDQISTAKGMSESLGISFEFLSKALQALMKKGLILSHQGIKGGYALARKPDEISVSEVIKALDDSTAVVECFIEGTEELCDRVSDCSIRFSMAKMQKKINELFNMTTLAELSLPEVKREQKLHRLHDE